MLKISQQVASKASPAKIQKGKIAIIGGTGNQGSALATRLAKAGEQVIIGSRSDERCVDCIKKIKSKVPSAQIEGMGYVGAAENADVIILAVPMTAQLESFRQFEKVLRPGQIIVDITNPLAGNLGCDWTETVALWEGSASQQLAKHVPKGVQVVGAFKNILANYLHDLNKSIDCDVFVCGDDQKSKQVVMDLVRKIPNARPVDVGRLEKARLIEQMAALIMSALAQKGKSYAGIKLTEF